MKRELLELRQKLMQRFLDGSIDQETYDRLLAEIEKMSNEESSPNLESFVNGMSFNGQTFVQEGIPESANGAIPGIGSVPAVSTVPGVGYPGNGTVPVLPPFVTIIPPGAQMPVAQMAPIHAAYPPGYYPGAFVQGVASGAAPGMAPNGAMTLAGGQEQAAPAMMTAEFLDVRTPGGVKHATAVQDENELAKLAPWPEIDPNVILALKEGETLEIWWHYPLTPECVSAWKKIGVPLRLSLAMNETIDDESMFLLGQITNLHEVNLTSTLVTDEGIRALSKLVNLESLILTSTQVTGKTFGSLENCQNLRDLTLTSTPFTNEGMRFLPQFKMLDSLKLDDTEISDEGMEALLGLHQMQLLNLQGTIVSDLGLKHISHMTSLVELYLGGTIPIDGQDYESPITDRGAAHLAQLTELRVLHLNDTQITSGIISILKKMENLYELNVTDTYFSDDALKSLRKLPNLHDVFVDGTLVTQSGIRKVFGPSGKDMFHGAAQSSWNSFGRFIVSPWSRKN